MSLHVVHWLPVYLGKQWKEWYYYNYTLLQLLCHSHCCKSDLHQRNAFLRGSYPQVVMAVASPYFYHLVYTTWLSYSVASRVYLVMVALDTVHSILFWVYWFPLPPRVAYRSWWAVNFFPFQISLHLSSSDWRTLAVEAAGNAGIALHMRWNCGFAAWRLGLDIFGFSVPLHLLFEVLT